MSRLFVILAGVWVAAGLATLVASAYSGDGAVALLLPTGALAVMALAWRALRIPFALHGRTVLAVACALGAGAVFAYGVAHPGEFGWLPLLLALAAVMGCGAIAAIERCEVAEAAARRAAATDRHGEDLTLDLEDELVRELTVECDRLAPPRRVPEPRRRLGPPARIGGLVTAMALLLAVPLAGLLWSHAPGSGTASAEGALLADVGTTDDADAPVESGAAGEPVASAMRLGTASESQAVSSSAIFDPAAQAASPARPPVDASKARLECLAQIESAHLFLNLARQAKTPSAYATLTNPQIKQMIETRPITPRTVQHIVMRMWERRHEPERDPEWWSNQYARCEATRLTGQRYVVRG